MTSKLSMNLGAPSEPLALLPQKLAEHALNDPDDVAIETEDASLSWREAFSLSSLHTNALIRTGVARGARIAILSENTLDFLPCFLGIVCGGYCAVTLPTMVGPDALAAILRDCDAKALFTTSATESLARHAFGLTNLTSPPIRIGLDDAQSNIRPLSAWLAGGDGPSPKVAIDPGSEFNIVYSSGTTGLPKGIVHSHATRAVMAEGFARLEFDRQAATLLSTPLYTNLSLPAFFATLWGGGRTLIINKFNEDRYLAFAERRGATHFFLVPVQLKRLLASPQFPAADLGRTRLKYVAGSYLDPELKRITVARWPGPLLEVYGMTEGAPMTAFVVNEHMEKIGSVGRAPIGSEIKIIDDRGDELPIGQTGEIVGRTAAMMLGYNGRPDATRELRWQDAFGQEFFRSGDIGKLDADGFLYLLDRKKDMIISGGLNIYAIDLERILAQHPMIADSAVVAVSSERWGEAPLAVVVLRLGTSITSVEVLQWANERLGKHQRLSRVEIADELPRNALGKVEKRVLRDRYASAAASDVRAAKFGTGIEP